MAVFSPELWRKRAFDRHQRAVSSGRVPDEEAGQVLNRDLVAIRGLERLVSWCSHRKIEVDFARKFGGLYDRQIRKISINGRLNPENQLHIALHECGHHLIGVKDRHERFGMGYSQSDPRVTRTFHHRCDILDEEFDAWHRGKRLASRLGIHITKVRYDQTRTEMLRSYMKWALRWREG